MSDTSNLTKLGSPTRYQYDHPSADILESFANSRPGSPWVVELDCAEFTALCPMTGQPDFGRVHILYVPDARCVESKSLKLYLGAYRNHGSFHEDCINRIADDLVATIAPRYLRVFGDFRPRGGIAIRPLAVRVADGLAADQVDRCRELIAQHDSVSAVLGGRS